MHKCVIENITVHMNSVSEIASVLVVFHWRKHSPTYSTHAALLHAIKLKSSSKGSSFPADSLKPVPLTVSSLDSK